VWLGLDDSACANAGLLPTVLKSDYVIVGVDEPTVFQLTMSRDVLADVSSLSDGGTAWVWPTRIQPIIGAWGLTHV
jgi:hypothetical protein